MKTVNSYYNECKCLARTKKNPDNQCPNKPKSNSIFCGIHIRAKNVFRIDEPLSVVKKRNTFIYKSNYYITHLNKIIKCQTFIRKYLKNKMTKMRGPAFLNRTFSNNDTDFLTYKPIKNISDNEFFSYKDTDGFVYSFNIKSIHYLLDYSNENPYTRKIIPENIIKTIKFLSTKLDSELVFEVPKDEVSAIKQKCITIFQRMDDLKLYTQPRWFLDLNFTELQKLYLETEDIWNYRTMLTKQQKKKYTKTGKAFVYPISKIKLLQNTESNKKLLQNIILNEYRDFVYDGKTDEDCITASYWILMGLGIVSKNAADGMPELIHSQIIN